jgi:hypothetical protein
VERAGRAPKYIVSDQGTQFQAEYRAWCKQHGVKPRFGAIGKHGSIALIERCIRSLKEECLRRTLVPFRLEPLVAELELYVTWFNEHRPHQGLGGKTPNEVFAASAAARDGPRWEPRKRYPLRAVRGRRSSRVKLRAHRRVRRPRPRRGRTRSVFLVDLSKSGHTTCPARHRCAQERIGAYRAAGTGLIWGASG